MRKIVLALALICWGCGEGAETNLTNNAPNLPAPTTQPSRVVQPPSGLITTRWVTNDSAFNDYRPTFSPDDRTVVFERNAVGNQVVKLHKVSSSGGTVSFLMSGFPQNSTRPDWSVTSNRIAFTGITPTTGTLWLCNPDGSDLKQVAPSVFRKQVDYPHWFPDGVHVAVTDYGDNGLAASKGIVRKVNVNSLATTDLTDPSVLLAGDSAVSPDGRWLVLAAQGDVSSSYNQNTNNIFVIDLNAPKGTAPILFDAGQGRAPSWSPDGSVILFESSRASANGQQYAIFAKRFSGQASDLQGALLQLTPDALDGQHAEFSHSGTQVVLTALQSSSSGSPRGILMLELASVLQNL